MIGTLSNELPVGNLRVEKKDFIQRKISKLEKDKKYGFTLSQLDNKIRKKHFGVLVNKLKASENKSVE